MKQIVTLVNYSTKINRCHSYAHDEAADET